MTQLTPDAGLPSAQDAPASDRLGIFSWCLFDWANSAFNTVIGTFIFSVYFARGIYGDETAGSAGPCRRAHGAVRDDPRLGGGFLQGRQEIAGQAHRRFQTTGGGPERRARLWAKRDALSTADRPSDFGPNGAAAKVRRRGECV